MIRVLALCALFAAAPVAAQPAAPPPPPALRGAFFALVVADAPRVADWYRGLLGFRTLAERNQPERGVVAMLLERDGAMIEIVQRAQGTPPDDATLFSRPGIAKIGFGTADLDALHAHLEAAGVRFNHHIVRPEESALRTFAVRDPEGNIVQFFGQ
jgi:catechol 2,3-dioxygenase-like lactoylglutathione lyase family enzyme